MQNSNLLNSIAFKQTEHTPIWIMRQAGRYLPEYRKVREKAGSFVKLMKNPELACEVTIQPAKRFDLDALILFSDILTIPDAMGMGLSFVAGEGPSFAKQIKSASDIDNLKPINTEKDLSYVFETIKLIKQEVSHLPLIGFSGSPWTLAVYMLEGASSKHQFNKAKEFVFNHNQLAHKLLATLTENVTEYLCKQIESGVNLVQLFDTWGGVLSQKDYLEYSLQYLEQIKNNIKKRYPNIPVIVFTKGAGSWLKSIADIEPDVIGLDWQTNLQDAKNKLKTHSPNKPIAVQGNLDPAYLYAENDILKSEIHRILSENGSKTGHIFNLGHGINPDVNPDKVKFVVDTVHQLSSELY